MLKEKAFLEGPKQEIFERRENIPEHIEREEPIEGCRMNFLS